MQSLRSARVGRPFRALPLLAAVLALASAACGDGGGGTTPDPQNPAPSIENLDPGTLLQWSDSLTITVTGARFVNGAVVRLNGSPRLTTYVSPSQVTAVIPAAQMQTVGTLQLTVFNPAPGGGESGALPLAVNHRVPDIQLVQPAGVQAASEAFTLTVLGAGFSQASVVRWNGADRPTTFVNPGQVTAQIPATDLATAGTAQVTVFNPAPGGGTSVARVFTVAARPNPVPSITALTPNVIIVETGATFTVTGANFMAGSQVRIGGFAPTTTFVSATELSFSLDGSNVPNTGFAQVLVTNPTPGGGPSNVVQLRVDNPAPVLASLSPATAGIGGDSLVVQVNGSGFVSSGTLQVDNFPRPFTRVSATELRVVLPRELVSSTGTRSFRVLNPQPNGISSVSNILTLTLVNPTPVIGSITPAQSDAGLDSLVVRVQGTGFLPQSVGRFNGSARTTRVVNATNLDVVLASGDVDESGTFSITVTNPAPGGGTSAPATLTLSTPVPTLALIPSNGASAGRPGFPLIVHGSGFVSSSVVRWNGSPRATRYISGTRLEASITTADLATPGTASITVHTPGGGTSQAQSMTVRPVGSLAFTSALTLPIEARDIAYEPASNRLYASVPSTAPAHAGMVLAIDPLTGAVVDSVHVGGSPGKMAISDDGSTLWVALDATGQVRRLSLPSLALGGSFSLGENRVGDMRVMPGRPGTVAVSRINTCCSPAHEGVAIYDDGVRRPRETGDHTGADYIVFGESAAVMYGQSEYGGFYTLEVENDGLEIVRQGATSRPGWQIEYANGRVYTSAGGVMDAARHEAVGAFSGGGSSVLPDATLGRIFILDAISTSLRVYDMNTFQLLDEAGVGFTHAFRTLRWGGNGLVMASNDGIRIYRAPIFGP
ncbi:MAG TPA: IPT/TIG domain-containing protein [Longimicrobium sp.]